MLKLVSSMTNRAVAVVCVGFFTWYFMSKADDKTVERRKQEGYAIDPVTASYRRKFMKDTDKTQETS